jgi:hypothetical protein
MAATLRDFLLGRFLTTLWADVEPAEAANTGSEMSPAERSATADRARQEHQTGKFARH